MGTEVWFFIALRLGVSHREILSEVDYSVYNKHACENQQADQLRVELFHDIIFKGYDACF